MPNNDDFLANAKPVQQQQDDFLGNATAVDQPKGTWETMRDNWHSNTDELPNPNNSLMTGAENVARSAAKTIGHTLLHPLDTLESSPSLGGPTSMASGKSADAAQQAQQQGVMHQAGNIEEQGKMAQEHPATAAGSLLGGALLGTGLRGLTEIPGEMSDVNPFPTRAKAGALLNQVEQAAGDRPVTLTRSMEPLERTQQLAMRGSKPFQVADQLYQRVNTTNPLGFKEARDFASNLSLSPEERMSMKGRMKGTVPQLSKAFNADVGDTAEQVGMRPQYEKGMRDYARASRMAETSGKIAKKIPYALGGYAAGKTAYDLFKK